MDSRQFFLMNMGFLDVLQRLAAEESWTVILVSTSIIAISIGDQLHSSRFFHRYGSVKTRKASSDSMPYLPVDMVFRFFPRWTRDKVARRCCKVRWYFHFFWRPLINGLLVVTLQETNISRLGKRKIIFNRWICRMCSQQICTHIQ